MLAGWMGGWIMDGADERAEGRAHPTTCDSFSRPFLTNASERASEGAMRVTDKRGRGGEIQLPVFLSVETMGIFDQNLSHDLHLLPFLFIILSNPQFFS